MLPRRLFILDIEKSSKKSQQRFLFRGFCRAFQDASFEKNRDFLAVLGWGYMRNKKCRKTFGTLGMESRLDCIAI